MVAGTVPLRQLRVVAAVAREGSAVRAAQSLHLSVSAVSRAVGQAESLLGLPLFERGARGMVPTPAALVLVLRVERALAQLAHGQQALASLSSSTVARARVARSALPQQLQETLLGALQAVAEARSEGGAARRLGVSQAAVHQHLQALEHAARMPLFERSHRGTRLTEAGERLLQHAKLAQAELRTGHDELAAFQGLAAGRLVVGALPMASALLLPAALSRLFMQHPGVVVTVADGTYEALLQQLRQGDIDLLVGPLRGLQAPPDVIEQRLFEDDLIPVVRPGHPLVGRRLAGLRSLSRGPWIGPLPGTPAAQAFQRTFAAAGLPVPPVVLQTHSSTVLVAVLQSGDAIAMVSSWQVRNELAAGTLVTLPLKLKGTQRDIGCTLRRDGLPSSAVLALQARLRDVVCEHGGVHHP